MKFTGNVFVGIGAGADLVEGEGIVIIGDGVRSLDRSQSNVAFLGDKVAIGEYVFGQKCNLKDLIKEYAKGILEMEAK